MARLIEQKFDPSRPVVARKYFIANGRKYAPGAELDWRKLGIAQRRVLQMFEAGKLCHDTSARKTEEVAPESNPLENFDYYEAQKPDTDLDAIDDMKELRRIADEVGAPYKVSKKDQREAIREHLEGDKE